MLLPYTALAEHNANGLATVQDIQWQFCNINIWSHLIALRLKPSASISATPACACSAKPKCWKHYVSFGSAFDFAFPGLDLDFPAGALAFALAFALGVGASPTEELPEPTAFMVLRWHRVCFFGLFWSMQKPLKKICMYTSKILSTLHKGVHGHI